MDSLLARTMVETLSKGIDPLSGRALPLNDSCSNDEIQNALLEVLKYCTIESNEQLLARLKKEKAAAKREANAERYSRAGQLWSLEEEKQLLQLHHKGFSIYKIANILKRTPRAIKSQLKKLHKQPLYRNKPHP